MSVLMQWLERVENVQRYTEKHLRALRILKAQQIGVEDPLEGDGIDGPTEEIEPTAEPACF